MIKSHQVAGGKLDVKKAISRSDGAGGGRGGRGGRGGGGGGGNRSSWGGNPRNEQWGGHHNSNYESIFIYNSVYLFISNNLPLIFIFIKKKKLLKILMILNYI